MKTKSLTIFTILTVLTLLAAVCVGCKDKNGVSSNALAGTTYKTTFANNDWESFVFHKNRYERHCPSWDSKDIQWEGYYDLEGDVIYCYYDQLPKEVEFTMRYCGDSIINSDNRVYYKQ